MFIYVNGDSYSANPSESNFGVVVAQKFNSDYMNTSINGSSNHRIFRTSLRDLMSLKKEHKNIVALISVSFIIRTELWDFDSNIKRFVNDGDFVSVSPNIGNDWFLNDIIKYKKTPNTETRTYTKYLHEWLRWYNVEAETINLLKEIITFTTWCKYNNINYLIFSGPVQEPVDFEMPAIKSFYQSVTQDPNIIDIFKTSFTDWCVRRGHQPVDDLTQIIRGETHIIGHHGSEAHADFGNYIFENYLKNFND